MAYSCRTALGTLFSVGTWNIATTLMSGNVMALMQSVGIASSGTKTMGAWGRRRAGALPAVCTLHFRVCPARELFLPMPSQRAQCQKSDQKSDGISAIWPALTCFCRQDIIEASTFHPFPLV